MPFPMQTSAPQSSSCQLGDGGAHHFVPDPVRPPAVSCRRVAVADSRIVEVVIEIAQLGLHACLADEIERAGAHAL